MCALKPQFTDRLRVSHDSWLTSEEINTGKLFQTSICFKKPMNFFIQSASVLHISSPMKFFPSPEVKAIKRIELDYKDIWLSVNGAVGGEILKATGRTLMQCDSNKKTSLALVSIKHLHCVFIGFWIVQCSQMENYKAQVEGKGKTSTRRLSQSVRLHVCRAKMEICSRKKKLFLYFPNMENHVPRIPSSSIVSMMFTSR